VRSVPRVVRRIIVADGGNRDETAACAMDVDIVVFNGWRWRMTRKGIRSLVEPIRTAIIVDGGTFYHAALAALAGRVN